MNSNCIGIASGGAEQKLEKIKEEDLGALNQPLALFHSSDHLIPQNIVNNVDNFGNCDTCYSLGDLSRFLGEMFEEEFQKLRVETKKIKINYFISSVFDKKSKNRYQDILPPDHTRVGLDTTLYSSKYYINANKICLHGEKYILTQGPLEDTVEDFWTMVIRERCGVIVCATKQIENNSMKCFPYWKYFPSQLIDGFRIFQNEKCELEEEEEIIIRDIWFHSSEAEERERRVAHMQITAWQDNVGLENIFFCQILKEINLQREKNPGALVVHCSAGVGRGGTIVAALSCLECIKKQIATGIKLIDCKIDIFNTVLEGRRQRGVNFVMTKGQYRMLYNFFSSLDLIKNLL